MFYSPARVAACAVALSPLLFTGFLLAEDAKISELANNNKHYRALRDAVIAESFSVENVLLKRDVGTLLLINGTMSFTAPVLGRPSVAVFHGEGVFRMKSAAPRESQHMKRLLGTDAIEETFDRLVIVFSDMTWKDVKAGGQPASLDVAATEILKDFRERRRRNTEEPRSMLEALWSGEDVENLEAEALADLYNPLRAGAFNAFMHGKKHNDLRFLIRPAGAFPGLPAPEEVALVNYSPEGSAEGIWYLAHYQSEYEKGTANSHEDKRSVGVESYKIDMTVGGNDRITAKTVARFQCVRQGDRLVRFNLLPTLRVSRVSAGGADIGFVQEERKHDSALYVIMPAQMDRGQTYEVTLEYAGDKVIGKAGGGNYTVGARTSWYPSLNAFGDRAKYDITYRIPKRNVLVSVGQRVKETVEGDQVVSQWVSDVPLAVAGFNFGLFKKKEAKDDQINYTIEGYATSEVPDYLRTPEMMEGLSTITPTRLTERAVSEAQMAMRIFTHWFGPAPYGRIAITQQPQFSFGQSWPGLVYLPLAAFIDSTQRWQLLGQISRSMNEFVQEVTPHEVAHQWWGHVVGWASHHDQWISEGFSHFSAAVYLQAVEKTPAKFVKFWESQRETLLAKNQYGYAANDAGPIWTGLRLESFKNSGSYSRLVYPKGAYVLHMLRMMMRDSKTGDEDFIRMMHDFTKTHEHKNASTESFKAIVEKHMKPAMDVDGNRTMDWFFRQWVYGTEVPKLQFTYDLKDQPGGEVLLTAVLKQSEVSEGFTSLVPMYLEFDGSVIRAGVIRIIGNSTHDQIKVTLPKRPKRVLINYMCDTLERK